MLLGENLNKTFGNVYLKNIPRAIKRFESFDQRAKNINLQYTKFRAIEGHTFVPDGYELKYRPDMYPPPSNKYLVGNGYSGIAILLDAMANNYESYVTCDDDTVFYDLHLEYIKPKLPSNWDIIILGQIEKCNMKDHSAPWFIKLTSDPRTIAGCHCIAVHNKCYNTFLMEMMKFDVHGRIGDSLIQMLVEQNRINLYAMLPHITYQERDKLTPYVID